VSRGVYFIQAGFDGPIKIGWANNANVRLRGLQTAHYAELRILATIPAYEPLEAFLHSRFADGHIRGEWFDPTTPGLAELIESAKRGTVPDWALKHVRPYVTTIEEAFADAAGAALVRHRDDRE
jgi:hypothetical protein